MDIVSYPTIGAFQHKIVYSNMSSNVTERIKVSGSIQSYKMIANSEE